MNSGNDDLFGKIDALRGKRAPDALLEKALEIEDFPLLTEVVDSVPDALSGEERRARERRQAERRLQDRRQASASESPDSPDLPDLPDLPALPPQVKAELAQMMAELEARLEEVFIRQQLRLEQALRRAVRDEMGKLQSEGAVPGADADVPTV